MERSGEQGHPEVGHQAPIRAATGSMAEEAAAIVRGAPRGDGDIRDAELECLPSQLRPKVERPPPSGGNRDAERLEDLRIYFIARCTNTYTTVHYSIGYRAASVSGQQSHPALEDPTARAPPPGMEQGDRMACGVDEVNGHAIGHRHGEENSPRIGPVAVDAIEDDPALPLVMPGDFGAMNLVAEAHGGESGLGRSERRPPLHDLRHRLAAPQAEVEAGAGFAPRRDAGNDAEALAPARHLEPGDVAPGHGGLTEQRGCELGGTHDGAQSSRRSMAAPRARSRASICS